MKEHEIWLTRLFNEHLAGMGNALLGLVHVHAEDPARPWANYITMQLVVALLIVVLFAVLKSGLSVDRPGKLQHLAEIMYQFLHGEAHDNVGHEGHRYLSLFGTLFIFILFANLIGIIPGFESPTQVPYVPAGLAMIAFLYYNWMGIRANGFGKYAAHFVGPIWWMAPLMIPIEIISHLARPMSLTIRLFANMYAGEQVTLVFLSLTYLIAPAIFMGLHVFVSFLQAYIFALLTMMYVGGAVAHEH
ncbi:MAG: F0F1 ATP synthase subunit A [Acidobacteriota bacterium]|nr:F0F1 ATP synthase subunit A [Acidobacteriota bacterium]